ncbi:MAG: SOS response-associated peptidase family protein [Alteraurantiacibacter sp. bin_em_oilr2.035]|nr:SOS response-associated peptidase family protein [Alteraurantiacibacter sp. bin_em_oilr2.035]
MCNLYKMSSSHDEVAQFFEAIAQDMAFAMAGNAPESVYPGYPGMVLAESSLQQMIWGFPLQRKGVKRQPLKPKPVNNAREDKLDGPFWSASFNARRCLIPISAFAEAKGPVGGKTRTWFSPSTAPLFAVAGLWRDTVEWGRAFTMVMASANDTIKPLHDRMPVILAPEDWPIWLDGDPAHARSSCQPYGGTIQVDHTDEPWAGRR